MKLYYLNNCFEWNSSREEWQEKFLRKNELDNLVYFQSKNIRDIFCDIFTYNNKYYLFPRKPEFEVPDELSGSLYVKSVLSLRKCEYKKIKSKLTSDTFTKVVYRFLFNK